MTVAKNDAEEGVETNSSRTVLLDWIKCRSARGCRWATRCRVFRSGWYVNASPSLRTTSFQSQSRQAALWADQHGGGRGRIGAGTGSSSFQSPWLAGAGPSCSGKNPSSNVL